MWVAYLDSDPYELPICVEDSITKLAWKLGITKGMISTAFKQHRATVGIRFDKVAEEEDYVQ
jgi:hypothetical protein